MLFGHFPEDLGGIAFLAGAGVQSEYLHFLTPCEISERIRKINRLTSAAVRR
jgi:hypothetical protein